MATVTNKANLSLSVAAWLAHDDYDHNSDPYTISATSLIKPVKEIILASRVPTHLLPIPDVQDSVASCSGTAVHDNIERVWKDESKREEALKAIGLPKSLRKRIKINPTKDEAGSCIPVYMEQRLSKQVGMWTVTGKFDFIYNGQLEDHKQTKVFTYISGIKTDDYIMQGSVYRWLDPEMITSNTNKINFIFKDWSAGGLAKQPDKYPPFAAMSKEYFLKSYAETDAYIRNKLKQIEELYNKDESEIPACTDEELNIGASSFKYYKNPNSTARSTKNFDTFWEAEERRVKDGSVGIVKEVKGTVGTCRFCSALLVCKQKDQYIAQGNLVIPSVQL